MQCCALPLNVHFSSKTCRQFMLTGTVVPIQMLEKSGTADAERLRASRELTQLQMAKIQEAAMAGHQHAGQTELEKR